MTDLFTPKLTIPLSALPPQPVLDERQWFPMRGKSIQDSIAIWTAWKAQGKHGANPTLPSSNGEQWCAWCGSFEEHDVLNCPKLEGKI